MKSHLYFIRKSGQQFVYPRAHLLSMALVSDTILKINFSSKMIVLTGTQLGEVFVKLSTGAINAVEEVPDRHAFDGSYVTLIEERNYA